LAEAVLTEALDDIGVVSVPPPEAPNAVNRALSDGLRAAFDRIEQDETIRVGLLCGAGQHFCAGIDLKALAAGRGDAILDGRDGFGGLVRRRRRKLLTVAVGGAARARGSELAPADRVPAAKVAEILLTGRVFGRDEAEKPKPEAWALARDITACAPMPISAIKSRLHGYPCGAVRNGRNGREFEGGF
jgi:enoyl-CoA hydratase